MSAQQHPYHLVNPSPWPLLSSVSALLTFSGLVFWLHQKALGLPLFGLGLFGIIFCMYVWWRDVVREGMKDKAHTNAVQRGLRLGMALFIVSEVMFFAAFFGSFFSSALGSVLHFEGAHIFENISSWKWSEWPPAHIKTLDAWDLPLINTLVLLLSGTTVTWAHYGLLHGDQKSLERGLLFSVLLGISFTALQMLEYHHAEFGFKDGVYPSNFFLATGFHGAHVLIGTLFLAVCYVRARRRQLTPENHLGFEFAAWYWHFVDVVWLFLFACVYVWGA
jgi:cytochrome c oxidase subunit 3